MYDILMQVQLNDIIIIKEHTNNYGQSYTYVVCLSLRYNILPVEVRPSHMPPTCFETSVLYSII